MCSLTVKQFTIHIVLLLPVSPSSSLQQQKPPESPEDWVDWFLHRLHEEPWAVGGLAVMGLFVLTALSLVVFALLYGCCSNTEKKKKKKKIGVI